MKAMHVAGDATCPNALVCVRFYCDKSTSFAIQVLLVLWKPPSNCLLVAREGGELLSFVEVKEVKEEEDE